MKESKTSVDGLFGDEEIKIPPPPQPTAPRRWPALVGGIIVLLLIFWWASDNNSRQFYLHVSDGSVTVEKGYYFPFGRGLYAPSRAYAPFELIGDVKVGELGALTSHELDEALKSVFISIANAQLTDLDKGNPDHAEEMIWRAQKLHNISISDDRKLLKLMGDVAFRRGLSELKGVLSRFEDALEQFQLSAMRGGDHFPNGQRWANSLKRLRGDFELLAKETQLDPELALGKETIPTTNVDSVNSDLVGNENKPGEIIPKEAAGSLGTLRIDAGSDGVSVRVGEQDYGVTPLAEPLRLAPGMYRVTFEKNQVKQIINVTVGENEEHTVRVTF